MADITFTDVKTQQVTTLTYVYDFNKSSINWLLVAPIAIGSAILVIVTTILIYRKVKKGKLQ
jgi:hypothetical protein